MFVEPGEDAAYHGEGPDEPGGSDGGGGKVQERIAEGCEVKGRAHKSDAGKEPRLDLLPFPGAYYRAEHQKEHRYAIGLQRMGEDPPIVEPFHQVIQWRPGQAGRMEERMAVVIDVSRQNHHRKDDCGDVHFLVFLSLGHGFFLFDFFLITAVFETDVHRARPFCI